MDLKRQKNEKLSELEEEEREKGEYLRKKANEQLQEQEDEIKKLNEVTVRSYRIVHSHMVPLYRVGIPLKFRITPFRIRFEFEVGFFPAY